ncbi:MAG: phosphoserine phosphatase SerB [Candidatus Hydrothermarchaeaceae archaeon]
MKLVVFDLDSTLIDGESLDEFGKLMKKKTEISKITNKAMVGEISFEEALVKRTKLLKGLEMQKIHEAVSKIPLMKGAGETVSALKKRGIKVAVVSGGFDVVADRVKEELGLDYAVANEFVAKDGKVTGEVVGPMLEEGAKGKILDELAKKAGIPLNECVAVGDGANDVSMLERAGLAIAFNSKPVLDDKADVVIKKKDLREVLPPILNQDLEKLREEKKEIDADINRLQKEVTADRKTLGETSAKRRELINSIKTKNAEANKYKAQRDALNEKVKNYKRERDGLNAKVKELVSKYKGLSGGMPRKDFKRLQSLRDSLEWKLQTSVLKIKKEDELVSKIEKLNSELNEFKDLISLSSNIDDLRNSSKKIHNAIIDASKESQVYHEKFLESVKNIKQLESQIDALNSERLVLSQEIDKSKAEINSLVQRARDIADELSIIDRGSALKGEKELKEEAKDIYERFKRGEKLGLGDIYLLRRFDLV